MRLPHVTWLRAFEAAARHSSFSDAAFELNLTPAAVSQQIRLLEQHLDTLLFRRLPRGVGHTRQRLHGLRSCHLRRAYGSV